MVRNTFHVTSKKSGCIYLEKVSQVNYDGVSEAGSSMLGPGVWRSGRFLLKMKRMEEKWLGASGLCTPIHHNQISNVEVFPIGSRIVSVTCWIASIVLRSEGQISPAIFHLLWLCAVPWQCSLLLGSHRKTFQDFGLTPLLKVLFNADPIIVTLFKGIT